jgi:hypothetical protein
MGMGEQQFHWSVGHKNQLAGQKPVGHATSRVDVRASVHTGGAQCLLRCDKCRSTLDHIGHRRDRLHVGWRVVQGLRNPKVQNFHEVVVLPVPAEKNVGWLDVPMHEPARLGL